MKDATDGYIYSSEYARLLVKHLKSKEKIGVLERIGDGKLLRCMGGSFFIAEERIEILRRERSNRVAIEEEILKLKSSYWKRPLSKDLE